MYKKIVLLGLFVFSFSQAYAATTTLADCNAIWPGILHTPEGKWTIAEKEKGEGWTILPSSDNDANNKSSALQLPVNCMATVEAVPSSALQMCHYRCDDNKLDLEVEDCRHSALVKSAPYNVPAAMGGGLFLFSRLLLW